jgi:hypothetical protein
MQAALPLPLAAIAIPSAAQCFTVLAPIAAIALLYSILKGIDVFLAKMFPALEWQRNLGWFNIKAERKAASVLRVIGHIVLALLAVALYGIAWGAEGLRLLPRWTDPDTLAELDLRLPVLCASLSLVLLYFGIELLPRLRREYEEEDLQAFRAELAEQEEEKSRDESSRLARPFQPPTPSRPRRPR